MMQTGIKYFLQSTMLSMTLSSLPKSVFPELLGKDTSETYREDLVAAASHPYGRVSLLYLFSGKSKALLSTEDLKLLDEIHRIREMTSKKHPDLRRKELLGTLSQPLLDLVSGHTPSSD